MLILGSKGAKSTMLRYLCMETEAQICQNLSSRCNVKENIIKKALQKARLDEAIKENFEKIPDIHVFQQSATDTEGVCKAYVAKIKDHLDDFEDKIIEKFRIISMIDFELNGVFRQANLQTGPSPDISKTLQTRILG